MAIDILMPKLGFAMNQGVIAEWFVADTGRVQVGQPLYSLESDKAVEEIEAPASGILKILVKAGESAEVGTVLGFIE